VWRRAGHRVSKDTVEPGTVQEFAPADAVWEVTMACNMRCAHCGSSCTSALPDELTTEEALGLCDQIADLGVERVTLSGGEPLLRADWPLLAERLTAQGVRVAMVSNGWLLSHAAVESARRSGVELIGISLDGLETTHDTIRKPGSYRRVVEALGVLRSLDFPASVITTVVTRNLHELPSLTDLLIEQRVFRWQIQLGRAIGNLASRPEQWLVPRDVPAVLDFAAQVTRDTPLVVILADCVGYYTQQEREVRRKRGTEDAVWAGCAGGRRSFGIRHNGDICACNTVRDEASVEGNIRESPLASIWTRPDAFQWYRARTRDSLTGLCRECQFSALCLAGCTSLRRGLCASDGENRFCAYRLALERLLDKADRTDDPCALVARADRAIDLGLPDVARHCLVRALHLDPGNGLTATRLTAVTARIEDAWKSQVAWGAGDRTDG
jgi:radical SAM protein with 4Fe4S-binding SPASM domain